MIIVTRTEWQGKLSLVKLNARAGLTRNTSAETFRKPTTACFRKNCPNHYDVDANVNGYASKFPIKLRHWIDCKQSFFFSKSVKKWVKPGVRILRALRARASHVRIFSASSQSRSLVSASFQTFCLTTRAYLNTQKYGLFCSLATERITNLQ